MLNFTIVTLLQLLNKSNTVETFTLDQKQRYLTRYAYLFPQKVLFSLGGSFLYYADRFKIYSAFCASHTKVPKVLAKGKNMHT